MTGKDQDEEQSHYHPLPQRHAHRLAVAAADRRANKNAKTSAIVEPNTGKSRTRRAVEASSSMSKKRRTRTGKRDSSYGSSSTSTTKLAILMVFLASFGLTIHSLRKMNSMFKRGDIGYGSEVDYDSPLIMPRKLMEGVLSFNASSYAQALLGSQVESYYRSWSSYLPQSFEPFYHHHQKQGDNYHEFWKESKTIPNWMKEYFAWHQEQKAQLTPSNWNLQNRKYLVMTCFRGRKCGGITDRLRPILALLRAAHLTNRILLIYWERPFPLEEFLIPPSGGLDWRLPFFMIPGLEESKLKLPAVDLVNQVVNSRDKNPPTILTTQYQSWNYGWHWYDELGAKSSETEAPALEVFKDVWNTVFVPSPPIQALIDQSKTSLGLIPGEFATAHIRALWAQQARQPEQIPELVQNAMNCASQLRPGGPFLVTSDHLDCLQEAHKYGAEKGVHVMTPSYDKEPMHVGLHNESDPSVTPQDFYSSFVDIYLISMSRCVTYGPGGYGTWGQVLGYNHSCWSRHAGERSRKCAWQDGTPDDANKRLTEQEGSSSTGASVAPSPSSPTPCIVNGNLPCVLNETVQQQTKLKYSPQEHLWDRDNNSTSMIPDWLKQYFQWHKETRAQLTPENYKNHRYMVMTCFRGKKCGGMTDRLRPILTELRVAYNSSRLFFIHWERPFPLEEYLLPPEGGLDWRLPSFLLPGVKDTQVVASLYMRYFANSEPMFVTTMYQSWHYGELIYDEALLPGEPDAKTVFRDVWNTVFTPSPPVADMIYRSFEAMGITPGHYATAHIRAHYNLINATTYRIRYGVYNINDRNAGQLILMVQNAMNCASNLRPGGPFFVVADSEVAVDTALEYGRSKNVTVVTTPHKKQPLHIGLHDENDPSVTAADFYDSFVDMYLIAETDCMVVGPGGFGRWGILLGHNRTCSASSSGKKAQTCDWKDPPPSTSTMPQPQVEQYISPFRTPMA